MNPYSVFYYQISLKEMQKALKHFRYDKTGVKKIVYKTVDKITPKSSFPFSEISYHGSRKDKRNYLNQDHTEWNHPCKKEKKQSESVLELYNIALKEANSIIKDVNSYLKDTKKINLKKVFKNLSYSTGLDCDQNFELKYFED